MSNWRPIFGIVASVLAATVAAPACRADEAAAESLASEAVVRDADLEFFEKQVRPILVRHCYECHSAAAKEPKGGLRLDSRAAILTGGDTGPALVPGDPSTSLLIDAVNYGDVYQMPPKSKLAAAEVEVLTRWVNLGAPWPKEEPLAETKTGGFDLMGRKREHWCWHPLENAPPPAVGDPAWSAAAIDRFILARLENHGLSPAPPADKRTLIRRVYFDLIGLPPPVAEVRAFVADDSPEAYERLVDRLLESKHFGERWARHWMDVVRYAETHGHEFDFPIHHAAKYRDYLIRAFNEDVPYDQLLREHLAGDLLDPPRRNLETGANESVLGTGFWFFGEATHAPVDVVGDQAGRIDNQIDVMTKTFLGLTVACARCHDHKFDAITTADYYALTGFLKSSHREEILLDPGQKIAETTTQLDAIRAHGDPFVAAAIPQLSAENFARYLLAAREVAIRQTTLQPSDDQAALPKQVATELSLDAVQLMRWIKALSSEDVKQWSHPLHAWSMLAEQPTAENFVEFRKQLAVRIQEASKRDDEYPLLTDFSSLDGWFRTGQAFGDQPPSVGRWDPRSDVLVQTPGIVDSGLRGDRQQGVLRSPTFTLTHKNIYYRLRGRDAKIRLKIDGYFMDTFSALLFKGFAFDVASPDAMTWHRQAQDVPRYLGHRGHIEIIDHGAGFAALDEIRMSNHDQPPPPALSLAARIVTEDIDSLEALAHAYGRLWESASSSIEHDSEAQGAIDLLVWTFQHDLVPTSPNADEQLRVLREKWIGLANQLATPDKALGMADGSTEVGQIYIRGNHRTPGSSVPRQLLEALIGRHPIGVGGSGRRELADQMLAADNPLTARVMVNRLWHHVFGRGIVASVDNFGVLGSRPTHPELLDHLACKFRDDGWSLKKSLRGMVLSRTYQMASTPDMNGSMLDPNNVLLHRMRIRRLQGEAIRDSILSISGRLDRTILGTSVPVNITEFMQGRGRPATSGPLDGNGRRSLYIEVRRNFLSPMMLAFDTPIPFSTVGRRNVSNVPAQALIMMNDPFVVEQARLWAENVLKEPATTESRIEALYLAAFARPPSAQEIANSLEFLSEHQTQLGAADADDVRLWANLCHVLMNVKEFVFIH